MENRNEKNTIPLEKLKEYENLFEKAMEYLGEFENQRISIEKYMEIQEKVGKINPALCVITIPRQFDIKTKDFSVGYKR